MAYSVSSTAFCGCTSLLEIHIPASVSSFTSEYTPGEWFFDYSPLSVYFYGSAAPAFDTGIVELRDSECPVTIYYPEDATGWDAVQQQDDLSWAIEYGALRFETWKPESSGDPETPPTSDKATILQVYPVNGANDVGYDASNQPHFEIKFDRDISAVTAKNGSTFADLDFSKGSMKIFRASDNMLIYEVTYDDYMNDMYEIEGTVSGDTTVRNGNTLVLDPFNAHTLLDPGTEYYITVDEGFIRFEDGTVNPAIQKGDWGFTTKVKPPTIYGSGFEMGIDSFNFANTAGYFGNEYFISDEYYNALLEKLSPGEKLWIKIKKLATMSGDFSGSCFGESAVMALMNLQSLIPSAFQSGAKVAFDLDYPKDNQKVASLINYYQLLQNISPFSKDDKGVSQQEMGQELINALLTGTEPIIVNLNNYMGGMHSVLAYAIDVDSNEDDYLVYIADSNALLDAPNQPADPTIMYVDKQDYTIESYIWGTNGMGPGNVTFLSVISDLYPFEKYNIQQSLNLRSLSAEPKTAWSTLTTSYSTFIIEANGKQATINGDSIVGDLEVLGPFEGELSGETGTNRYTYYIEEAQSYKISNIHQHLRWILKAQYLWRMLLPLPRFLPQLPPQIFLGIC